MKLKITTLISLSNIICLFLLTALMSCSSFSPSFRGLVVPPENLVVLQNQGTNEGKWQTELIIITYLYSRDTDSLNISGQIDFTDRLKGKFTNLDNFSLWIHFVNSENKITGNVRISPLTALNQIEAADFERNVQLPPATKAIAFSYSGQVSSGSNRRGEGIVWRFWKTPHG